MYPLFEPKNLGDQPNCWLVVDNHYPSLHPGPRKMLGERTGRLLKDITYYLSSLRKEVSISEVKFWANDSSIGTLNGDINDMTIRND